MNGIRRVLYHLDEIVQSDPSLPVYIVEGEKDADRLRSLGLMATCNPNGAGQWRDEYNAPISGHPVVIIPDHDVPGRRHAEQVAGSLHGHAASVKILHLPGLPDKGDVSDWLDAGGTKDELERLVEQTPAWEPAAGVQAGWTTPSGFSTQSTSSFVRYQETEKGLVYLKGNESGYTPVPLCNFTVRIREEIVRDNGVEQQTHLVVEGKLSDGSLLPSVRIPSSRLANLSWVTELWGVRAIVYAGQNIKDHLRVAIQTLSQNVEHRTVYTHLGWRNIGDDWIYLHSGGAIGPHGGLTDIHVEMEGRLDLYSLPHPPTGRELREAVQASLGFLELAPYRITYPLLSAVYRSLLGEAQRIDCSVFLA
ncbi:MAG TPA: DNA primase, partial [bacterium]|nr:DNA primase [bacterium]